jgi:hypothetical protein
MTVRNKETGGTARKAALPVSLFEEAGFAGSGRNSNFCHSERSDKIVGEFFSSPFRITRI